MAIVQIIGAPQSPFVRAALWAAAEKGVEAENVPVAPHTPEVDAIHPFGKIPVMRHGDVTLAESRAIVGYIDSAFDGPPLFPRSDAAKAAVAEQWISLLLTYITPVALQSYILPYFVPGPDGKPDRKAIEAALPGLQRCIEVMDSRVKASSFIGGADFGIADIYAAALFHYVGGLPEGAEMIGNTGRFAAYLQEMLQRPGAIKTSPPPMPKPA